MKKAVRSATEINFVADSNFLCIYGEDTLKHCIGDIYALLMCGEDYWSQHFTINDIMDGIKNGKLQFWILYQNNKALAGVLTQILVYPKHKSFMIIWLGGHELPTDFELQSIHTAFRHFARNLNCVEIEAKCRPGLEKVLAPYGWKKTAVYLSAPVDLEEKVQ